MKDKHSKIILAYILIVGLSQLLGIERLLNISKYAMYYKTLVFIAASIYFWRLPKKRSRIKLYFQSDFGLWALVLGFLFVVSVFFGGVLNGFGNNPYLLSLKGITFNFTSIILPILLSAFARQYVISSTRPKNKIKVAIALTFFIALSQFSVYQYLQNGFEKETVIFLAGTVLPVLAREALVTYFTYMSGVGPAILYLSITTIPFYVLDVVPDLEWITSAFAKSLLPFFGILIMHETYSSKAKLVKLRNQDKDSAISMIVLSVVSVMLIWFVVGVFPISPKVILTGSMEPEIMPGDMVLIEFIEYEDVEIGDTILFSYGEVDILHRVIAINEDQTLFQTKGDNNPSPDSDWVTPEQIKGIQKGIIPYIGKILVWLRSK